MKKCELKQKLLNKQIPKHFYNLNGGLPNEKFSLNENNGIWEVYYSERGNKTGLRTFEFEEDACDYFYNELIKLLRYKGLI